jgi:hypothetical protein
MTRINFAISITTIGLLIFTILCSVEALVPLGSLLIFLFLLNIGLVWMVITILKNGDPSPHLFDKRFYEDADKGPFE